MLINIFALKDYCFHDFLKNSLINEITKWFTVDLLLEVLAYKFSFLTKNEKISA